MAWPRSRFVDTDNLQKYLVHVRGIGAIQELVNAAESIDDSDSARRPIETVAAWQKQIPTSQLTAMSESCYHAAATQADSCAEATAEFIAAHQS